MKKFATILLVGIASVIPVFAQDQVVKEKLSNFFFDLPFNFDIEVLRSELQNNPNFKFYHDPNRDARKTIVGAMKSYANLNPLCLSNQIVIQYSSAATKKNKKVSLKWSMNYKLEDLPSAIVDFEKLKSEFKPLFIDYKETIKIGAQKEEINSLVLKGESLTITITLIEHINYSHSISLEYRETGKLYRLTF